MKTMSVGEFKTNLSEALEAVRKGETIVIFYGRGRQKVAAMVPYRELRQPGKRPLGLLKGKVTVRFSKDFAIEDASFSRG